MVYFVVIDSKLHCGKVALIPDDEDYVDLEPLTLKEKVKYLPDHPIVIDGAKRVLFNSLDYSASAAWARFNRMLVFHKLFDKQK